MPKLNGKVPKYRLHKVSGQAIVTLDGEDRYLGEHGSQASVAKYDRLVAEWLANGRRNANLQAENPKVTVNQVIAAYWEHAKSYYRKPDGTPTMEVETLRQALKPLKPHAVALTLRAIVLGSPALVYVVPDAHTVLKTEPNGVYWRYDIRDVTVFAGTKRGAGSLL